MQAQEEAITEEDLRLIQERESSIRQLEVRIRMKTVAAVVMKHLDLLCVSVFTVKSRTIPSLCCSIQSDITDINDIFKDLGMMVHEQGDMIGELLPAGLKL